MRLPIRLRAVVAPVALVVVALALAACGTNGTSLRAPAPGVTAPVSATTTVTTVGPSIQTLPVSTTPAFFSLSSDAFQAGSEIPSTFSCDGAGTSPPLTWYHVPPGTAELVLVVDDADLHQFVHWLVAGIKPTETGIPAGATPPGAIVLANGSGTKAYAPMCPPKGDTHTYEFTLYALTKPSGFTASSDTAAAIKMLQGAHAPEVVLTGTFTRSS